MFRSSKSLNLDHLSKQNNASEEQDQEGEFEMQTKEGSKELEQKLQRSVSEVVSKIQGFVQAEGENIQFLLRKTHMKRFFECAVNCTNEPDSAKAQQCINTCQAPFSQASSLVEQGFARVQRTAQECLQDCQLPLSRLTSSNSLSLELVNNVISCA